MVKIVKRITDIENIYTYFLFDGYSSWDDFDTLLLILTDQMKSQVLEKLEGIYSKHCTLNKKGFVFKLMYHEDFGNCLCNQNKQDDDYYNKLNEIANDMITKI